MALMRSDPEPLYEGDLTSFVAAALRSDTVDEIVEQAEAEEPIDIGEKNTDAEPYVEKMLEEEIEKQFGDPERSLVDLTLNSVDARPDDHDGEYTVNLYNTPWSFTVKDEGDGMDAQTIVERLLVPFSSEKDPYEDIGRFGVGFYSSLEHPLANPEDSRVAVATNDGEDAYRLEFWSEGDSVEDLNIAFGPSSKRSQGTTVSVKHPNADMDDISEYVDEYIGSMDPGRVTFRGFIRQLNTLPEGEEHRGTFEYDGEEHNVVAVTDPGGVDGSITVTSQGVQIMDDRFIHGNVHFNLPPVVKLVEGRNAFKQDDAYEKAVETGYQALAEGLDATYDDTFIHEMFPDLEIDLDVDVPTDIKEDVKNTTDEGTYLVPYRGRTSNDMVGDRVKRFVAPDVRDEIFTLGTKEQAFWNEVYRDTTDLVSDTGEITAQYTAPEQIQEQYMELSDELGLDADSFPDVDELYLVEHDQPGPSPFLRVGDTMYIVEDHPLYEDDSVQAAHAIEAGLAENSRKRMDMIDDDLVFY